MRVFEIGLFCEGSYTYGPLIAGTLTASVNETDLLLGLFVGEEETLPVSTNVTLCEFTSMKVLVHFTSSGLDYLSPILQEVIEQALYTVVCEKFVDLINVNVTNALINTVDPALVELTSAQSDVVPSYGSDYIHWGNSIVATLHNLIDRIGNIDPSQKSLIKNFLSCLISSQNSSSLARSMLGPWLPGVLDTALNALVIDLTSQNITFQIGSNSSVTITTISLDGFNTLSDVSLLEPSTGSNVTLGSSLSFDYIDLQIGMTFNIVETVLETFNGTTSSIDQYVYSEDLVAKLHLADIVLVLDLLVAVNQYVLDNFYLDQLDDISCWLYSLQEVSVPNLVVLMNVTEISIDQLEGSAGLLESGIVELVNNALLLVTAGFDQLVTDVVAGIMQGPVRSELNAKILNAVNDAKVSNPCLTHYPYQTGKNFVAWVNNSVVQLIDRVINDQLGANGLNQLMSCATNGTGTVTLLNNDKAKISLAGLDSFSTLYLLSSSNQSSRLYNLVSDIGLGSCPDSSSSGECNPLRLIITSPDASSASSRRVLTPSTATLLLRGFDSGIQSYEDPESSRLLSESCEDSTLELMGQSLSSILPDGYSLEMSFQNLNLYLDLFLKLDKNAQRDLHFGQLGVTGCIASAFQTISVADLSLAFSAASFTSKNANVTMNITRVVSGLFSHLTSDSHLTSINSEWEQRIASSSDVCASGGVVPDSNDDIVALSDDSSSNGSIAWEWQLFILGTGGVASLFGLLLAYQYWGKEHRRTDCFDAIIGGFSGYKIIRKRGNATTATEDTSMPSNVSIRTDDPGKTERVVEAEEVIEYISLWDHWDCKNALVFHEKVPVWLRIAFPLVVIADIYLFIDSNMDPSAVSVFATIDLGPKEIAPPSIFDFGLGGTVSDMWTAEVYALAILIAFFSGAWPYIKLVAMLFAWILPPTFFSIERREIVLRVLDALGKWSLIDFYVMVLMIVAFHFSLNLGPNLQVYVNVVPNWGFYGFLLATILSLSLGHILLACHRLIIEPKILSDETEDALQDQSSPFLLTGDHDHPPSPHPAKDSVHEADHPPHMSHGRESLFSYVYHLDLTVPAAATSPPSPNPSEESDAKLRNNDYHIISTINPDASEDPSEDKEERKTASPSRPPSPPSPLGVDETDETPFQFLRIRVTLFGAVFVSSLLLAAIVLIGGTFLNSVQFDFQGLTGLLLKGDSTVQYSCVSIGTTMPEASGKANDFAIRWMEACYFLFNLAMPLALMVALSIIWFAPLHIDHQKSLFVLAEVLNAWSALDVFGISIAAALLEIQQFAVFIVGDKCDGINKLLVKYFDTILDGNDKCFDVVAKLLPNSWVTYTAAFFILVISIPSLGLIDSVLKSRLQSSRERLRRVRDLNAEYQRTVRRSRRPDLMDSDSMDVTNPLSRPLLDLPPGTNHDLRSTFDRSSAQSSSLVYCTTQGSSSRLQASGLDFRPSIESHPRYTEQTTVCQSEELKERLVQYGTGYHSLAMKVNTLRLLRFLGMVDVQLARSTVKDEETDSFLPPPLSR